MTLPGGRALVTGGSRGVGSAVANRLGAAGAFVTGQHLTVDGGAAAI